MKSPINWIPPDNFDEYAPGLGCPRLEAAEHRVIYDPKPSKANVDEGGDGAYESLHHGTFCHGPRWLRLGDDLVITWSNHTFDEGGPGGRKLGMLAKVDGEEIVFDEESYFELIPQCGPTYRREWEHNGKVLRPYPGGGLSLINGTFYAHGNIGAVPGFTNAEEHRHLPGTRPEGAYSETVDEERGFVFDMWVNLGLSFVQKWKIDNGRFVPDSPMYKRSEFIDGLEITPGRWMEVTPLWDPYASALPFEEAPEEMKRDILEGTPVAFERTPKFAPGMKDKAADGINALAHAGEFQRPDGTWVVLRDNLLNKHHYYASEKKRYEDDYPPGVETNMLAGANPECGELPDGRVFVFYNTFDDHINGLDRARKDMMLTISEDGRTFDKSWLVHRVDREPDGGVYKFGGPQYFKWILLGGNLWVFYSITKMQIGVTKIPVEALG